MKNIDSQYKNLLEIIQHTAYISTKIHGVFNREEIFKIVETEFGKSKKYQMFLLLLSDNGKVFHVKSVTIPNAIIRMVEKVIGKKINSLNIDIDRVPILHRVINNGETYSFKTIELSKQILSATLGYIVAKITGHTKKTTIVAPIKTGNRIIGILAIDSPELIDYFTLSVKNLSQHISTALELAEECEKRKKIKEGLRHLNLELEKKVSQRTFELYELNKDLQEDNIAKQEMLEKEKELNVIKSCFISIVSHEFRTPLAGIKSSAELLERNENKWDIEKRKSIYKRIQNSISFIVFLLNNVSLIGKDYNKKLKLNLELIKIEEFINNIHEEINCAFGNKKRINISINLISEIVLVDINIIRHILYNLLSNAIKYSANNTEDILFEITEISGSKLKFIIADKGIGIPKEDMKNIFNFFHRAKNADTIKGTGLGLAIVKRCIEVHNGTIEIESKENVGTTVTVIIPFNFPVESMFNTKNLQNDRFCKIYSCQNEL